MADALSPAPPHQIVNSVCFPSVKLYPPLQLSNYLGEAFAAEAMDRYFLSLRFSPMTFEVFSMIYPSAEDLQP